MSAPGGVVVNEYEAQREATIAKNKLKLAELFANKPELLGGPLAPPSTSAAGGRGEGAASRGRGRPPAAHGAAANADADTVFDDDTEMAGATSTIIARCASDTQQPKLQLTLPLLPNEDGECAALRNKAFETTQYVLKQAIKVQIHFTSPPPSFFLFLKRKK